MLSVLAGSASAHDASSYGGVFRSRDLGATWLNADVGLFINAAIILAVDPRNSSHLLVGTDLGVLSSRNGGRSWVPEARDLIVGAVFALAFSPDGELAVCASASGVFRHDKDGWRRAKAPDAAIPARALVAGPANNRFYLRRPKPVVRQRGRRSAPMRPCPELPDMSEITALVAIPGSADVLAAVIGGRAMISQDRGRSWRNAGFGDQAAPVDTIATDAAQPRRIWAAAGGRIVFSDDLGSGWHSAGRSLPEARVKVRGIAASADATTWWSPPITEFIAARTAAKPGCSKQDNLPIHLEAGPLARDPNDAGIIYAVFSLMPYAEVWRMAIEGGNLLARVEPISLAGGLSFVALVLIGGGLAALVPAAPAQRSLVAAPIRFKAHRDDGVASVLFDSKNGAEQAGNAGRSGTGIVAAAFGIAILAGGAFLLMRVAPAEKFVEYRMDQVEDEPIAIAAGTDGSIWFTIDHADAIGRVRDGHVERLPYLEPQHRAARARGRRRRQCLVHRPRRARASRTSQRWRDRKIRARYADRALRTAGDRTRRRRLVRRPDRLWHDPAEGRCLQPLSDQVRARRALWGRGDGGRCRMGDAAERQPAAARSPPAAPARRSTYRAAVPSRPT